MIFLEILSAILISFRLMKYTDISAWLCYSPLIISMVIRIYVAVVESRGKADNESKN